MSRPSLKDAGVARAMRQVARDAAEPRGKPPRGGRVGFTVNLDGELAEPARDAVYWTPSLTLAELVAKGLETAIAELERRRREPFRRRAGEIPTGRPIGRRKG